MPVVMMSMMPSVIGQEMELGSAPAQATRKMARTAEMAGEMEERASTNKE
jgi:hypothetical protein